MPVITIKADANKALELLNAYSQMDGQDKVQNVNGNEAVYRVPFVLGPTVRLAIVRNMIELRKCVANFDEVKKSILKSLWPDAPDIGQQPIPIKDFPPNVFDDFKNQMIEAANANIDEVKLSTVSEDQLMNGNSEFPFNALACLIENGLITSEQTQPSKRKK